MSTKIEWAEETWNPIIGCSKISAGCMNCYAARMAKRQCYMRPGCEYQKVLFGGFDSYDKRFFYPNWNGKTAFVESVYEKPLKWKKPRRIFVCSMGDLFHESVLEEWIIRVLKIIRACKDRHTFMLLTKRPHRMHEFFSRLDYAMLARYLIRDFDGREVKPDAMFRFEHVFPNLWLGVTVENQREAFERIPILFNTPAAVRFISCEPLLEKIELSLMLCTHKACNDWSDKVCDHPDCECRAINWVIAGAETGPGKRFMDPDWAEHLMQQCRAVGIPFFFKKDSDGNHRLNGVVYEEMPGGC